MCFAVAGPYGDPNRFDMSALPDDNMTIVDVLKGSYERCIARIECLYCELFDKIFLNCLQVHLAFQNLVLVCGHFSQLCAR